MIKDITELFEDTLVEATIDEENNIIKGVAIMSTNISKNERKYSDAAMESITKLSEGCKCFLDHPSPQSIKSGQVRSIRDFCGMFSNPKLKNGQIKADLKLLESHFPLFKDLAQMGAPVGMSINARVKLAKDEKGFEQVIDAERLHSIDAVSSPALTTGLFEQHYERIKNGSYTFDAAEAIASFMKILTNEAMTKEERMEVIKKLLNEKELK